MYVNKLLLSIILIIGVLCVAHAQKCSVTIEGYHYDVSKLMKSDQDYQYKDNSNGDVYYFNICNNTVGDNPCGNDMVAYKYNSKKKECLGLGSKREYYSIHNNNGDNGPSIMVSYRGGDEIPNNPRARYELSYVFQCDPSSGDGEPVVFEPNEYGVVVVQWRSKYGCIAAYSQLIVNRDYDNIKVNYINNNNNNNNNYNNNKQSQQSKPQQVQNDDDGDNDGSINQSEYFVKKNIKPYYNNNNNNNIQLNNKYNQDEQNENQDQHEDEQNENQDQHENEINDQQQQPQQQDELNQDDILKYQRYSEIASRSRDIKPTENIENPYSPAFFEKVLPGIKDLDKLNMDINNQKKASNMAKNDKVEDYLEILKKTYKEHNQFTPPETNRNDQVVHKNDENLFI